MKKFKVRIDKAPGSGKSVTFTIMKTGSAQAMAVTIADTNTEGEYTGDLSIAAGDDISVRCTQTNTPTLFTRCGWSFMFEPTTTKRFVIVGGTGGGMGAAAGTNYNAPSGGYSWTSSNDQRRSLIAVDGTIRSWRMTLSGAPDSGVTYVVSIYKNGSIEASSSLTFTSAASTTQSVSGLSIDIAPGDYISLGVVITGTITNNRFCRWGIEVEPDNDGESQICGLAVSPANTGTYYRYPTNQSGIAGSTTESQRTIEGGVKEVFTLSHFRANVTTAPGSGKSWSFRVRKNSADGNLNFSIADTNNNGSDTSNSDQFTYGDDISIQTVANSTPAATTRMAWAAKVTMLWTENPVTKSLQYAVKRPVAITRSLKYTVRTEHAAITKSLKYTVRTTPNEITKSLRYAVRTEQGITKTLNYKVRTEHVIQLGLRYEIETAVPVSIEKTLRYAVRTIHALTKQLQYAVKAEVPVTKSLKYTVHTTPAPTQKSLKYTVLLDHALTKALAYFVRTEQSLTKSLKYTVVTEQSVTKSLSYRVLVEQAITKSLRYAVRKAGSITKGLVYAVRTVQPITKSLRYAVKKENAQTKSLKYTVHTTSAITKSLKYGVLLDHVITRALSYFVRSEHDVTKSLKYTVKSPVKVTLELTYIVKRIYQEGEAVLTTKGDQVIINKSKPEIVPLATKQRKEVLKLKQADRVVLGTRRQ